MKKDELKDVDGEDLETFLEGVEHSFGVNFLWDDLGEIRTIGQLSDHILGKVQLNNVEDCTTQQAFYKLRDAISSTLHIDKKRIVPGLPLKEILPWSGRRKSTRKLENHLGFNLDLLHTPGWMVLVLILMLLTSLVFLFLNWQIGLLGLTMTIVGIRLAPSIHKAFSVQTVGELAEKMMRETYLESRRDPKTVNKREMEKILMTWLADFFDLDKVKLTRESTFGWYPLST
jgi:hypothetical protein